MINNHGNNGGGNPNHDENGRFTSKGNASSGKTNEKVMNQMGLDKSDFDESSSKPALKKFKVWVQPLGNSHTYIRIKAKDEDEAKRKAFASGLVSLNDFESVEEDTESDKELINNFNKLKEECKEFANQFPWEEKSKENILKVVDESSNAEELFWGFLFNFYDTKLQNEMNEKFPGSVEKLKELANKNAEFYGKLDSNEDEEMYNDYDYNSKKPEEPSYPEEYKDLMEEHKKNREKISESHTEADQEFLEENPYEDYGEADVGKKWRN